MIKTYPKTAFRSLVKNKGFTFINVLGLALGPAARLLIVFYVFDELSYDRFNTKADRVFRVNNEIKFGANINIYATSPVSAIVGMLSKDFILLVFISIAIATPLAWWAMHNWLQGFAYRQNIQWWVVALAGAGAIAIAFVTISFQSVKAALTNPVKSLKSE